MPPMRGILSGLNALRIRFENWIFEQSKPAPKGVCQFCGVTLPGDATGCSDCQAIGW